MKSSLPWFALVLVLVLSSAWARSDDSMSCDYRDAVYKTVAAPSQTPNWTVVESASVKCDLYKDSIQYMGPYATPEFLTFRGASGQTVTIKNTNKYSLHDILIGPDFPRGVDANKWINEILDGRLGAKSSPQLVSFRISSAESVYKDSQTRDKLLNPKEAEVAAAKNAAKAKEEEELRKSLGIAMDAKVSSMTLGFLKATKSMVGRKVSCILTPDKLTLRFEGSGSESYFYDEDVPLVLKALYLKKEDCTGKPRLIEAPSGGEPLAAPAADAQPAK